MWIFCFTNWYNVEVFVNLGFWIEINFSALNALMFNQGQHSNHCGLRFNLVWKIFTMKITTIMLVSLVVYYNVELVVINMNWCFWGHDYTSSLILAWIFEWCYWMASGETSMQSMSPEAVPHFFFKFSLGINYWVWHQKYATFQLYKGSKNGFRVHNLESFWAVLHGHFKVCQVPMLDRKMTWVWVGDMCLAWLYIRYVSIHKKGTNF